MLTLECQDFCREAVTWRQLRHPNIIPLVGVTVNSRRFAMVSEWMENGNVMEFIGKDQNANRIEFVCVHLNPAGLWLT